MIYTRTHTQKDVRILAGQFDLTCSGDKKDFSI